MMIFVRMTGISESIIPWLKMNVIDINVDYICQK
jgi:hypothetical protein